MKRIISLFLFINSLIYANPYVEPTEKAGDYVQISIPLSAWITTLVMDDTQGQIDFYKSFGATFATTQLLKHTVNETRPDGSNTTSFPSGHTSASFQGATFIHKRYGLKYAILPYIGAAFVGFSRVYAEKHYTHDVLAGALIGSGFAWYFTTPYKTKKLEISPVVFNSTDTKTQLYGLNIIW